jgi:hypothetical protein
MIAYIFPGQGRPEKRHGAKGPVFERFSRSGPAGRRASRLFHPRVMRRRSAPATGPDRCTPSRPCTWVNALTYLSERASAVRGPRFRGRPQPGRIRCAVSRQAMVDFENRP